MRKIAYIIKFTRKKSYAEELCYGSFYMHPAHYYQHLQSGRGDLFEGAFSSLYIPEKQLYLPIYSMYVVYEDQIKDHTITIDVRMIDHFKAGYATIFKWKDWLTFMESHCFSNDYTYNLVHYQMLNLEAMQYLVTHSSFEHLFFKRPLYSYQQEFRLVIHDPLDKRDIDLGHRYQAHAMPQGTIIDIQKCLKDPTYLSIVMNESMIICDYTYQNHHHSVLF